MTMTCHCLYLFVFWVVTIVELYVCLLTYFNMIEKRSLLLYACTDNFSFQTPFRTLIVQDELLSFSDKPWSLCISHIIAIEEWNPMQYEGVCKHG
jgi:hypothetical protein